MWSFFEECIIVSKPQFNFQQIEMSRILLSIKLTFGCSSCGPSTMLDHWTTLVALQIGFTDMPLPSLGTAEMKAWWSASQPLGPGHQLPGAQQVACTSFQQFGAGDSFQGCHVAIYLVILQKVNVSHQRKPVAGAKAALNGIMPLTVTRWANPCRFKGLSAPFLGGCIHHWHGGFKK